MATRSASRAGLTQVLLGWLLALAALFVSMPVQALSLERPLGEFYLETWDTSDGLPHNVVQAIAQTPDGYLWFGTWEGLVRYNGREFRVFDRASVREMRDNGVRALAVGRDGSLWIGTSRGGVLQYLRGRWRSLGVRDGLAADEIMSLHEDRAGRLWIGTEGHGVTRLSGTAMRHFTAADGLAGNATITLSEDSAGRIWVGTTQGASRIDGDQIVSFAKSEGLPGGPVFSVAGSSAGGLKVGTEAGLFALRDERFVPDQEIAGIGSENISKLLTDRDGNLWLGTASAGLARHCPTGLGRLTTAIGLPNNRIAALLEDREGSLWVGTNGGLLRIKDAPFSTYTVTNGLADNYVRATLQDRAGTLWIGTSAGLSRFRDGQFDRLGERDGLVSDSVLALAQAGDGALWIGSYDRGISVWSDGRVVRTYSDSDGLVGNQVRAIKQTQDGAMWIGTSRGLSRLQDGVFSNYTINDGLPRDYVIALHESADRTLWVGTANGLARSVDGRFVAVPLDPSWEVQDVFGFYSSSNDVVWIATDRGLVRHQNGRYTRLGLAEGLPSETLFGVVEDRDGNFWLPTNRGVLRVARSAAEARMAGETVQLDVSVFGEADGMASAQCNGGSGPPITRARDDMIWVATAKGVAVVQPAQLGRFVREAPPVVIEEVWVDDVEKAVTESLKVEPGARKFRIRFAGLSYLLPEKMRFRYQLEGFDADWIETRSLREAQYTNLAPGDYRFRVTAANSNGPWNPAPAEIVLTLAPRYFQTPWFVASVLLLAALLVFGSYRLRVRSLKSRARNLSRLVEARTLDLVQQTARLQQANEEKTELLARLREQSEAFERQAREDALTGLANRRNFDEILAREFEHARNKNLSLAVAIADLDYFKRINDCHSHAAGDAVLKAVATVLRACIRPGDQVARLGGEEFALLFPATTLQTAVDICERIRGEVAAIDTAEFAPGLRVSISIGVSNRADAAHHEKLLSMADGRLYEAKRAGRNQVCS